MAEEKKPGQGWEQTTVAERRGRGGRGTPVGTEFYTATLFRTKRPEATPSRGNRPTRAVTQPIRVVVNNKTGAIDLYEVTNTGDKIFNRFDPSKGKWQVPSADTDAFVRVQNSLGLEGLQRLQNDARRGAVTGVISPTSTEEDKRKILEKEGYKSLANTGGSGGGDQEGGNPIPSAADDSTDELKFDLTELEKISAKPPRASYGNLRYPLKMNTDNREKQDVIKFTMIEYTPSLKFSKGEGEEGNSFALGREGTAESTRGTVTLPIQPTIIDSNSVNWQEDSINSLMLAAADVSTGFIKGGSGGLEEAIKRVLGTFKEEGIGNATNALTAAAASAALGNNIFTRATGAILNPNMELLFNGPSLRQFSYSFNLSARSAPESKEIQKIIRFFKQGMSVQRSPGELFLVTPDIFKIQYILKEAKDKEGKDHPYINRIKTCALTNCSVDYTPTGSYMTFEDGAMVSYTLNLSFEELEPIYHDDYDALDKDEIGY
jgi:hypothetical protein